MPVIELNMLIVFVNRSDRLHEVRVSYFGASNRED